MHAQDSESEPTSAAGHTLNRLRDLFDAVVDLHPHEREAWLSANVADDKERETLRQLLAADAETGFLDTPAAELDSRIVAYEFPPDGLIGQQIGAFRLVRALGQGGMACVFLAERVSADFSQQVAIKLLRRGLYSELEQRLFQRERQVLAALEHPNIARLIDGGVTQAGIPYLVMEFVAGVSITHYAHEHGLDVRARLALFLDVCRAVEAAHRNLIVHRDIKPPNILVTAAGEVKLLDFGIAKLLEEDTTNATGATVGVFTPGYAAPEQVQGGPITTATDVYGLGVLLHELLLGLKPDTNTGSGPRRPSSRVAEIVTRKPDGTAHIQPGEQLRRVLRGDLDNIILKALEAEPGRRYASAGTFADDIDRYLGGRPVVAHPPTRWYRTHKFIQRHRGGVTVTAILALAVVFALGVAVWQAKIARQEAARAREVQAFVQSLFAPLVEGTAPDKAPGVRELVQRGVERVDGSFHDDLRAQAELLDMFSDIQKQIGETQSHYQLAERAYRVSERAYGANDEHTLQAHAQYAVTLFEQAKYDEALVELTNVREAMLAHGMHGKATAEVLDEIAAVRMNLRAPADDIVALCLEALRELKADSTTTQKELAVSYSNIAVVYANALRWQQALEMYQQAEDITGKINPESADHASLLGNLGQTQFVLGLWREALANEVRGTDILHRIEADTNQDFAGFQLRICFMRVSLELDVQVPVSCDDAVSLGARAFGESHPMFARMLSHRAGAEIGLVKWDAAKSDLSRARTILAGAQGSAAATRENALYEATLDYLQNDYAGLRDHLRKYIANEGASFAPLISARFALACQRAPGDGCDSDAVPRAERVLADPKFAQHPHQLAARIALAQIDLANGKPQAVIDRVQTGLTIALPQLGDKHSWIGEAHLVLGNAYDALGDHSAALAHYAQASSSVEKLPLTHPLRARIDQLRKA